MDRAQCPNCNTTIGLGSWSEPGECPTCGQPLMLTCELRALTPEELDTIREARNQERASSAG